MQLTQLEYFLLLAEQQHVSRTAEMLRISQPSLSVTIKKLEKELGCPLFERSGRSIRLSPYGRAYLSYVQNAFDMLEQGKLELKRMKDRREKGLTVGILSPYIWQSTIQDFTERYPEMSVGQISFEGVTFAEPLLRGEFDFYLGATNGQTDQRIAAYTLYDDDMAILMSGDHPFAGRNEITLFECRNERFVMLPKASSLQRFIDQLCEKAGFVPRVSLECDYTLRDEMVAAGYGISVTTMRSAIRAGSDKLAYARITDPPDKRVLGIAWNKSLPYTDAMKLFFAHITGSYATTPV